MLRQLDQRESDGVTITLEWDSDTGDVLVRCEDSGARARRSRCSRVEPQQARYAFLHPPAIHAVEPQGQEVQDRRRQMRRRWRPVKRGPWFKVVGTAVAVIWVVFAVVSVLVGSPRRGATPATGHPCVAVMRPAPIHRTNQGTARYAMRAGPSPSDRPADRVSHEWR